MYDYLLDPADDPGSPVSADGTAYDLCSDAASNYKALKEYELADDYAPLHT